MAESYCNLPYAARPWVRNYSDSAEIGVVATVVGLLWAACSLPEDIHPAVLHMIAAATAIISHFFVIVPPLFMDLSITDL